MAAGRDEDASLDGDVLEEGDKNGAEELHEQRDDPSVLGPQEYSLKLNCHFSHEHCSRGNRGIQTVEQ